MGGKEGRKGKRFVFQDDKAESVKTHEGLDRNRKYLLWPPAVQRCRVDRGNHYEEQ